MPTMAIMASMQSTLPAGGFLCTLTMLKQFTSVSFGRLLVLAGRKMRLSEAHYEAALHAIHRNSDIILATNLRPEQVSWPRISAPKSQDCGVALWNVKNTRDTHGYKRSSVTEPPVFHSVWQFFSTLALQISAPTLIVFGQPCCLPIR